jgi:hypothetical protein
MNDDVDFNDFDEEGLVRAIHLIHINEIKNESNCNTIQKN